MNSETSDPRHSRQTTVDTLRAPQRDFALLGCVAAHLLGLFGSEAALGGRASLSTGVEVTMKELARKRCRTITTEHQDMADLSVFDPPGVIRVVRAPGMRGT